MVKSANVTQLDIKTEHYNGYLISYIDPSLNIEYSTLNTKKIGNRFRATQFKAHRNRKATASVNPPQPKCLKHEQKSLNTTLYFNI